MPETLNSEQLEQPPIVPQESGDLLEQLQQEGENRTTPKVRLNDVGIDKAAQDMFAKVREIHSHDSESGGKQTLSEDQKKALASSWITEVDRKIDSGNIDGFDEIEKLSKILSGDNTQN